jgi:hypothetical protein
MTIQENVVQQSERYSPASSFPTLTGADCQFSGNSVCNACTFGKSLIAIYGASGCSVR